MKTNKNEMTVAVQELQQQPLKDFISNEEIDRYLDTMNQLVSAKFGAGKSSSIDHHKNEYYRNVCRINGVPVQVCFSSISNLFRGGIHIGHECNYCG